MNKQNLDTPQKHLDDSYQSMESDAFDEQQGTYQGFYSNSKSHQTPQNQQKPDYNEPKAEKVVNDLGIAEIEPEMVQKTQSDYSSDMSPNDMDENLLTRGEEITD